MLNYLLCFLFFYFAPLYTIEDVYLKAPHITVENCIGTNVGIRPFRKTGVRIEAELHKEKLIIHNYGYGGSGLTLAFGGSKEVLDILQVERNSEKVVAVLGAGVVGLATAYDLLAKGYEVHIYSEKWSPHLTSNVAAGSWTPYSLPADAPSEKKLLHQRMLETAEKRLLLSTTDNPEFKGVKLLDVYILSDNSGKPFPNKKEVYLHFDNGVTKHAFHSHQVSLDGNLFMEDLYTKVKGKGALLFQKQFNNIEEILELAEPIVINCMSMGAGKIFEDEELFAVRGQLVYFKPQQDITYILFQKLPEPSYFFHLHPWQDRLILGGVYEYEEEELEVCKATIDTIINNAKKCLSEN